MSEPAIRRKTRRQRFTVMDNTAINDRRLGFAALGVLTYLLSKPDNWTIMPTELQRRGGIGRDGLRTIMRQLGVAGYAKLTRTRGDGGHITGTVWEVSEEVSPSDAFSVGRPNRRTAEPSDGESAPLVSTDTAPSTETAPTTDNVVVVAPRPAPPDHDDDAGHASSAVDYPEASEALDTIAAILAANPCRNPKGRALIAWSAIRRAAPTADATDIQSAADDWAERWERIKGHAPDPLQASQLPDVVAGWMNASRTASRAGHGLVPVIER